MTKISQKWIVFTLMVVWFFLTMFPLYWVLITSFKNPPDVNRGPTYLPFVDFVPTLSSYIHAFSGTRGDFVRTFLNSTLISVSATVISVVLGSMVAYALVRFVFQIQLLSGILFAASGIGAYLLFSQALHVRDVYAMAMAFLVALAVGIVSNQFNLPGPVLGNKDVVFWFISQRMMPPIVSAFALYLLYSKIGKAGFKLLDSYTGLTLCYVAFSLPMVVWLMKDFFQSLPVELEEAALVDNVPRYRIFFELVVPVSLPGFIAVSLITFGFVWNEFLFALILTAGKWQTLPILLAGQNSQRGDEWWAVSTAAIIAVVPMIVLTVFLARLMRSGLLVGSIK